MGNGYFIYFMHHLFCGGEGEVMSWSLLYNWLIINGYYKQDNKGILSQTVRWSARNKINQKFINLILTFPWFPMYFTAETWDIWFGDTYVIYVRHICRHVTLSLHSTETFTALIGQLGDVYIWKVSNGFLNTSISFLKLFEVI